jgi:hypothetical protein
MMNQPLRRLDPLGRSARPAPHHRIGARLDHLERGSAWPISSGSRQAIVDTRYRRHLSRSGRPCAGPISLGLSNDSARIVTSSRSRSKT